MGGLSLLGSAFLQFQSQREKAAAAKDTQRQLQRQRQAAQIRSRRESQQRAQERRRATGSLRARLAGQGIDLSAGTGRRLVDLTASRFEQADEDARAFRELEEAGFTSALGAARRARGIAGINQFLAPSISLLSAYGGFKKDD